MKGVVKKEEERSVLTPVPELTGEEPSVAEFSRLTLMCSDDPAMATNVRTVVVEIDRVNRGAESIAGEGGIDAETGTMTGVESRSRRTTHEELGLEESRPSTQNGLETGRDGTMTDRRAAHSREGTIEKEDNHVHGVISSTTNNNVPHTVDVVGLETGRYYYFQLVASHSDVDGPPSPIERILVGKLTSLTCGETF